LPSGFALGAEDRSAGGKVEEVDGVQQTPQLCDCATVTAIEWVVLRRVKVVKSTFAIATVAFG